jgi:hypothetical protein
MPARHFYYSDFNLRKTGVDPSVKVRERRRVDYFALTNRITDCLIRHGGLSLVEIATQFGSEPWSGVGKLKREQARQEGPCPPSRSICLPICWRLRSCVFAGGSVDHYQSTVVSGLNADHASAVGHDVLTSIGVLCLPLGEPVQDRLEISQINDMDHWTIVVRITKNVIHQERLRIVRIM